MRFQIQRTRELYEASWPGIQLLEAQGQLAVGAAAVLYRGILDQIEKHDYDVFSRRASLNLWGKLSRMPALWWSLQAS